MRLFNFFCLLEKGSLVLRACGAPGAFKMSSMFSSIKNGFQGEMTTLLEVSYMRFLKRILHVRTSAHNPSVWQECDVPPLRLYFWRMVLRFYNRLCLHNSPLVREVLRADIHASRPVFFGAPIPSKLLKISGILSQSSACGVVKGLASMTL